MDKNWSYLDSVIGFSFFYLVFSVVDIIGTLMKLDSFMTLMISAIAGASVLLLTLYLFVFRNNGLNNKIEFYGQDIKQTILLGVTAGLILGCLGAISIVMEGGGVFSLLSMEYLIDNLLPTGIINKILFILFFVVLIPLIEEYYFRGFMLPAFGKKFGLLIAIIITSIFSSVFLSGSIAFVFLFISSIAFGFLAEKTRGLYSGLIGHVLMNLIIVFTIVIKGGS